MPAKTALTPAQQRADAWRIAITASPCMTRPLHLDENVAVCEIALDTDDLGLLNIYLENDQDHQRSDASGFS
jgi:hypothetical protein